MTPGLSAVLLAAGRSTRMGRDKALLEIDGTPLWRRQRDVLVRAGATEIFLSARADQPWAHEPEVAKNFTAIVRDSTPDAGPLAGLSAALVRAAHPHLAVLAIDLPKMNAGWFASLVAECAPAVGCVGRHAGCEKFFEPLAAIYPRELAQPAAAALARGEFSLQQFLSAAVAAGKMHVREITAAETLRFENWNAPASLPRRE